MVMVASSFLILKLHLFDFSCAHISTFMWLTVKASDLLEVLTGTEIRF